MTGNGTDGAAAPDSGQGARPEMQFGVLTQYLKDMSFESPNAPQTLQGPGEKPSLDVNVNVFPEKMNDKTYEVAVKCDALFKNESGVVYQLEIVYAALIELMNVPDNMIAPMLYIEAPALIFPFVRRIITDMTREGGFPPLALDPINFAALYQRKLEEQAGKQQDEATG